MSVRKRKWTDKHGHTHEKWMIHVDHTWPDGRTQTIRKVSPVQTKRGAEQYEREVRMQLFAGQTKEETKTEKPPIPTLDEFASEFLAHQATLNKPTVLDDKRRILRVHLLPAFGKLQLDQIDTRSIDAYKTAKLREGKAATTINQHLLCISRVLHVAHKWKLITELPEIGRLKARKTSFDFLTFDECEHFLATTREHMAEWYPYMVVAVRTGLRVGEMLALRWREDVDLERGRLRVQQSLSRKHGVSTTKNDKTREIPLTWDAREALLEQRKQASGDLVFPLDGMAAKDSVVNQRIAKACRRAGLRELHSHVLRHTFASHAVMRGIPMRQVQEWMGHASVIETMRYSHLAEDHGDELIQRMAPAPTQATATQPMRGPAGRQHMDSTRHVPPHERRSKSP